MLPPVNPEPFTVSVNCVPPAFTDTGVMDATCGPLNEKLFNFRSHAPRPCVAARSVRDASCMRNESTATRGRPLLSVSQVHGNVEQLPINTPRSDRKSVV